VLRGNGFCKNAPVLEAALQTLTFEQLSQQLEAALSLIALLEENVRDHKTRPSIRMDSCLRTALLQTTPLNQEGARTCHHPGTGRLFGTALRRIQATGDAECEKVGHVGF
jgi:hypothetical protein